jgi:stage II sporulation protein D
MKDLKVKAITVLYLVFNPAISFATPWITHSSPPVRVRISDATDRLNVRGFDLKFSSGKKIGQMADRTSEWNIRCSQAGEVSARIPGSAYEQTFYSPLKIESPSGFVSFQNRRYRDSLYVYSIKKSGKTTCEVVNHVEIEKYLDGLVNSEFNAKWERGAIDAQVIAARTYAFYQMRQAKIKPSHYDLDSTIKDQVYDGSMKEDYRSSMSAERTRGQILSSGHSQPIKAYYHSTCGGMTELPEGVWGKREAGFKRRVVCHYCRESPAFVWDVPLQLTQVSKQIQTGLSSLTPYQSKQIQNWPSKWKTDLGSSELLSLDVSAVDPSSRATLVRSTWKKGTLKYALDIPATWFRQWVGTTKVKSTGFQILPSGPGQFVLRGKGYGHGVGLCQWGAKVMGDRKKNALDILKFYYPDAQMARAW